MWQNFKACNFIKNETPAQVFSFEFTEIFKNTLFLNTSGWLLLCYGNSLESFFEDCFCLSSEFIDR